MLRRLANCAGVPRTPRLDCLCPVLVCCACQAGVVGVIECGSNGDCLTGDVCTAEHSCLPDPSAETRASAGAANFGATLPSAGDAQGTLLTWDAQGRLYGYDNPFGILGGWMFNWDCPDVEMAIANGRLVCPDDAPTPGCCARRDPSLMGPDLQPGWSIPADPDSLRASTVCMKGLASPVLEGTDGMPVYGVIWGVTLGLILNDYSGFDATAPFPGGPIRGFSFDLQGAAADRLRAGVNTPDNFNDYFENYGSSASGATVILDHVQQGPWVEPSVPLDTSRLQALDFVIPTVPERPTPFAVCVSNVRVLQ